MVTILADEAVRVYVREISSIPPLSPEEEDECVAHVRARDGLAESAAKRLIEANLPLVVFIAERYRNDRSHILNLIQRGNEGLLRAVQTLPDSSPDTFATHATSHIERAIGSSISD